MANNPNQGLDDSRLVLKIKPLAPAITKTFPPAGCFHNGPLGETDCLFTQSLVLPALARDTALYRVGHFAGGIKWSPILFSLEWMSWAQHQWGTVEVRGFWHATGEGKLSITWGSNGLTNALCSYHHSSLEQWKKNIAMAGYLKKLKDICLYKVIKSTSGDLFYFQRWKPWLRGLSTIPTHGAFIYHVGCSGWRVNREKEMMAKPQALFHTLSVARTKKGPLQLIQTSLKKSGGKKENTYRISQLTSSIKSSGFCSR